MAVLDRLADELRPVPKKAPWARLFGKPPPPPRGVYLWGGVGRGKSMLMDLAFEAIPATRKRRVHFHEFMLEVHERLRAERVKEEGDPIPPVARAIAAEARLLAFDEMVINNAADAMILSRLFGQLLEHGVTVVTTSNRPPGDLYLGGLNRELFLPFIDLIERELDVVPLNGPTDYRLERLGGFPDLVRAERTGGDPGAERRLLPTHRLSARGPGERAVRGYPGPRRSHAARAQEPQGRRRLLVQAAVRGAARGRRLSRHRPPLPQRHRRRHPGHGPGQAQRGGALRHSDRRPLRA